MPRVTASEVLPAQPGQMRTDSGLGPSFAPQAGIS